MVSRVKESYLRLISLAIEEDIGSGDITSLAVLPEKSRVVAKVIARERFVLCGIDAIKLTYSLIAPSVKVQLLARDGEVVVKGQEIARVSGPARSVLSGERIVLNFISRLSGIAALTAEFVQACGGKTRIADTRKTAPGWRALERYAVRCGGGINHRMGLYDQILIKDNHIRAIMKEMGVTRRKATTIAIQRAKAFVKEKRLKVKVEVEVEDLVSLKGALEARPDIIMLDNMGPGQMEKAIGMIRESLPSAKIEISGKMTLAKVRQLARLRPDYISVGAITHSAPSVDVSMEVE